MEVDAGVSRAIGRERAWSSLIGRPRHTSRTSGFDRRGADLDEVPLRVRSIVCGSGARRHGHRSKPTRRHRVDADFDRAGAADDAGAGVLLRRPRALEERAQHDDDELHLARLRRRALGGHRLLAGVRARQRLDRRHLARRSCAASASSRRARFRTCCSCATRARSASSPPR